MIKSNTEQILKLEKSLLQNGNRKSRESLTELLADNFIEFGSSGKIYTRQETIESLSKESADQISIENFSVTELHDEIILATYTAVKHNIKNEKKNYSLRSSVWKYQKNKWVIVFHQGTYCKL